MSRLIVLSLNILKVNNKTFILSCQWFSKNIDFIGNFTSQFRDQAFYEIVLEPPNPVSFLFLCFQS